MARVLVVGGYGAFGARAAERLAREPDLEIVVAGRSAGQARVAAERLASRSAARISHAALDAMRPDAALLRELAPAVLVNASGPFQAQDYALARAAISVGAHYIDLADARAFVTGISSLDAQARAANVLVTSGASSVPALAAAIIDDLAPAFGRIDTISHGITPANGYDPGIATTASILGGLGQPMPMLIDGHWRTVHGWQGLRRVRFPGLGTRLVTHCDVPDLELFPARYPAVRTARFAAGLEVKSFQLALWALSWPARWGILRSAERFAAPLMWLKRRLGFLGSDAGGLWLQIEGTDHRGTPLRRSAHLIARDNQGPYVPALPSVILARKLARGESAARGAMPCLGLITLGEIRAETADLAISIEVTD